MSLSVHNLDTDDIFLLVFMALWALLIMTDRKGPPPAAGVVGYTPDHLRRLAS